MNIVLRDLKQEYGNVVLCYVDDVLIATTTIEQHLQRLDEVFQRLAAAGLKCKPSKCKFMQKTISFLGRIIGEGEVHTKESAHCVWKGADFRDHERDWVLVMSGKVPEYVRHAAHRFRIKDLSAQENDNVVKCLKRLVTGWQGRPQTTN